MEKVLNVMKSSFVSVCAVLLDIPVNNYVSTQFDDFILSFN